MLTLLSATVAAAVAAFLIDRFCDPRSRFHFLDRPNARSLHDNPTPRSGGLGIMIGVAAGWGLGGVPLPAIMGAAFALALISLADDVRHLPIAVRFGAHLLAAAFVVAACGFPVAWWLPGILAIGWMTNLYNFMDGSDGLAGGMALFGFSTYAVAAGMGGAGDLLLVSACLAAAAGAFLLFNFAPARIFMGDVGSVPLGFLAATLGLAGWQRGVWPAWFPWLTFSPFVVDATVTLVRRALRGERVWQAHREHYYQRMVRSGLGHAGTAWRWYAVMAAACLSGLAALFAPQQIRYLVLMAWVLIYLMAGWRIDRRWRRVCSEGEGRS